MSCMWMYLEPARRVPSADHFTDANAIPSATCDAFPGARILFLDGNNTVCRLPDGALPDGVEALQASLRLPALEDVLIVACGTWKSVLSLERIREFFDDDIAARIVDRTPDLGTDDFSVLAYREIYAWLDAHPEIAYHTYLGMFYGIEPAIEDGVFVGVGVFGENPDVVRWLENKFNGIGFTDY